jgi:hypothetical protein
MNAIYMNDADYYRLIDFLRQNLFGGMFADMRDELVFALGEKAGIWPDYTRPATNS